MILMKPIINYHVLKIYKMILVMMMVMGLTLKMMITNSQYLLITVDLYLDDDNNEIWKCTNFQHDGDDNELFTS